MFSQDALPFWTAVAALAAGMSALVAAIYTGITYRLVRLQSDPRIIVYTKPDLDRPSIISLVIENIGRDVAYDVEFHSSRPIPSKAFGIAPEDARPAEEMSDGPLIEGIPQLGPGSTREITWGQYGGLIRAVGATPIKLTFTYRFARRRFSGEALLECRSYCGTDASRKPPVVVADSIQQIDRSLRQIAEHVTSMADGTS